MLLFGLTGGVASGKSSVGEHFRKQGLCVIDADQIAREVVLPGSAGLAALVDCFGGEILLPDGSLDRTGLGRRVFADDAARAQLNGILHPRIAERTRERAGDLAAAGHAMACYEAALLVENGLADAFRPLVVVAVTFKTQLLRLMDRDGMDEQAARARIAAQHPLEAKVAVADHVIWNEASRDCLHIRAGEVLAVLRSETMDHSAREPG